MHATMLTDFAVLALALLLLPAASAQRPELQCTESGSTIATSLVFGEPTISLSPDMRSLAGVSPSVVLNIAVPAGSESVVGEILVLAVSPSGRTTLPLHRAEYWKMGSFPRAPVAVLGTSPIAPMDPSAETLYKLYFLIPKELPAEFEVVVAPLRYKSADLKLRPTLFRRDQAGERVLLCPWTER